MLATKSRFVIKSRLMIDETSSDVVVGIGGGFEVGSFDVKNDFVMIGDFGVDVERGIRGIGIGGNGAGAFFGRRIERRRCSARSNSLIFEEDFFIFVNYLLLKFVS